MKKHIIIKLISILLIFASIPSLGQINKNGLPFTVNYNEGVYGSAGQIWSIIKDKQGNMLFGCNAGLLKYNGESWQLYGNVNSTVTKSLAIDNKGNIYYGAESDFGIIVPDSIGELNFISIYKNKSSANETMNFSSIWKTYVIGNYVYFQALEELFRMKLPIVFDENNKIKNKLETWLPKTSFHISFTAFGKYYINEIGKGLMTMKNNKLEFILEGDFFADKRIYSMLEYDKTKILILTRRNGLYLYDTNAKQNALSPFNVDNFDLLTTSLVYNAIKLSDGTFAIGTLLSGVIVINKDGKIIKHLNKENVLEDNYILSMFSDSINGNGNLWLGTNEKGIYKTAINSNFYKWDKTNGIDGIVSDVINFKGKTYITTNNGVYYLDEKPRQSSRFKQIISLYNCWDLLEFKIDGNNSKLLIGAWDGIFEINDTIVTKILDNKYVYKLYQSKNKPENIYVGNANGFSQVKYENNKWSFVGKNGDVSFGIRGIIENKSNKIIISAENTGIVLLDSVTDENITLVDDKKGLVLEGKDFGLYNIFDKIVIASQKGLFEFDEQKDTVISSNLLGENFKNTGIGVYSIFQNENEYYISAFKDNIQNLNPKVYKITKENNQITIDSTFSAKINTGIILVINKLNEKMWFSNTKGLYTQAFELKNNNNEYYTLINNVITTNDSILFKGTNYNQESKNNRTIALEQPDALIPTLSFKNNDIAITFSATFFDEEDKLEYSYRLVGYSEIWSKWKNENKAVFTNLYEGEYIFEVKAKNIYNKESTIATYKFNIKAPWYRTYWAYAGAIIWVAFLIYIIIKLYTRKLKIENENLERIVKERTAEISLKNTELQQSKEEIETQRDEIEVQRDHVIEQKDEIEQQKKSILASIQYASRIQRAVLPPKDLLESILPDYFVLFRPRDIVSGDFYWATHKDNKAYIIAADSTGHGVPGAFMSMLGMSFLNAIVNSKENISAAEVLNSLRNNVKKSLRQTGKENEAKDGMDIALCVIDYEKMKMEYAGAYNPLYIIRNNEITRVAADRMPIGIYIKEKESFTNNVIDLEKNDQLYIFSDGFADQFGGPKSMKIRSKAFKEVLLENNNKTMPEQKEALINYLENWMAYKDKKGVPHEQIDDILIIGIRI